MKNETSQPEGNKDKPRESKATQTLADKTKGLDFSKLDLTVERVDERLSPSETNIFDK